VTRLAIERLGGEGDGLARHDGAVIAVPFTLPDEEVEGEFVEGTIPDARILRSSPHRVKAPCGQFRRCGGCNLQHADDATVAAWKRTQVVDALSKAGIIAPEAQVVTSPPRSRIRATLAGRRTKKGAQVGFHARASDQIVPAEGCVLVHPDLGAALPLLEALTRLLGSRKGEVTMALTRSQNGLDIDISGGRTPDAEMQATLAALMPPYKVTRLTFSGDLIAQQEPPVQRLGKALVAPPPGAFLQATDEGRDALVAFARSELAAHAGAERHDHQHPRSVPPPASGRRVEGFRRGPARPAARRCQGAGGGTDAKPAASDRACLVQSRDLRTRRRDTGCWRLPARKAACGRSVPLVSACRAGQPIHAGRLIRAITSDTSQHATRMAKAVPMVVA
jgi:hypothetical protein